MNNNRRTSLKNILHLKFQQDDIGPTRVNEQYPSFSSEKSDELRFKTKSVSNLSEELSCIEQIVKQIEYRAPNFIRSQSISPDEFDSPIKSDSGDDIKQLTSISHFLLGHLQKNIQKITQIEQITIKENQQQIAELKQQNQWLMDSQQNENDILRTELAEKQQLLEDLEFQNKSYQIQITKLLMREGNSPQGENNVENQYQIEYLNRLISQKNKKIELIEDQYDQVKIRLEQTQFEIYELQKQYKELEADYNDQYDHFAILKDQLEDHIERLIQENYFLNSQIHVQNIQNPVDPEDPESSETPMITPRTNIFQSEMQYLDQIKNRDSSDQQSSFLERMVNSNQKSQFSNQKVRTFGYTPKTIERKNNNLSLEFEMLQEETHSLKGTPAKKNERTDESVEIEFYDDIMFKFNQSSDKHKINTAINSSLVLTQENDKHFEQDLNFFKLTLLSQLMTHKYFILVKNIDANQLYYKAKGLPFTEYHNFISKEIGKYYLVKKYNADPERFLGKEQELKQYNGAKIYVESPMDLKEIPVKIMLQPGPRLAEPNLFEFSYNDEVESSISQLFKIKEFHF